MEGLGGRFLVEAHSGLRLSLGFIHIQTLWRASSFLLGMLTFRKTRCGGEVLWWWTLLMCSFGAELCHPGASAAGSQLSVPGSMVPSAGV